MPQLIFTLTDEQLKRLKEESETFGHIAMRRDPSFTLPTFDSFVRAKLLDNPAILTEDAVAALLSSGEYGWAIRSFEKSVPDLFKVFIEEAAQFGYSIIRSSRWSRADTTLYAQQWAAHVVAKAGGSPEVVAQLAAQIVENTEDFAAREEAEQTPAWHVVNRLHEMLHLTRRALDTASGAKARDRLGQLRALMRLAIVYGSLNRAEERTVIESLRIARPELFVDEPTDIFARIAAVLRKWFLPHTLRSHPSEPEPS
jgi:hypothetical protein